MLSLQHRATDGGPFYNSSQPTRSELALARIPGQAFGRDVAVLRPAAYLKLPFGETRSALTNRFIHGTLLYGPASGSEREDRRVYLFDAQRSDRVREVPLGHGVERIDAIGSGALVSGRDSGGVVFSSLDLVRARVVDREVLVDDPQRGMRLVAGVFYQASERDEGVLALPIYEDRLRVDGAGAEGSAEVLFLRQRDLHLVRIGVLATKVPADDATHARPIFWNGRVTALVGSELLEGQLGKDELSQVGRASFGAP